MKTKDGVSIDEFRSNLADYINRVRYRREKIIVKKHNKEAAVLISPEEYAWLTDPTKRFTKKEWREKFSVFEDVKADNVDKNVVEIERDLAEVVHDVRVNRRQTTDKQ